MWLKNSSKILCLPSCSIQYHILPNKSAGHSSKVTSDSLERFLAFQRWFRTENQTIIKESVLILASYNKTGSLQNIGGSLIRGGALNWQITVSTLYCIQNFCKSVVQSLYYKMQLLHA